MPSRSGFHTWLNVAPASVLFHTPPVAAPAKTVLAWVGLATRSVIRPPMLAGPRGCQAAWRPGAASRVDAWARAFPLLVLEQGTGPQWIYFQNAPQIGCQSAGAQLDRILWVWLLWRDRVDSLMKITVGCGSSGGAERGSGGALVVGVTVVAAEVVRWWLKVAFTK